MNNTIIEGNSFITEDLDTAKVIFTTGENDFNVYFGQLHGKENLECLKKWFNIDEIGYLRQCHSNIVQIYDGSVQEGDAIITDKPGTAVGVFTADCVPVLIYDKRKNVTAAVHSGWRGTYSKVVSITIDKMKSNYGSQAEDMLVYIGPHMRDCCYEVGDEVIDKFTSDNFYSGEDIFDGRKLSMEKCILKQLKEKGVAQENVKSLGLCTYCSKEPKLYSYRKGEKGKRLFSLIFIK